MAYQPFWSFNAESNNFWYQVTYSTCCCSNGHPSKYWTGSSLLNFGDLAEGGNRCFQRDLTIITIKLCLPKQKWTINKTLIFFKIRGVLKKYWVLNCIYQDRNEQWMKCSFQNIQIWMNTKKNFNFLCFYLDCYIQVPILLKGLLGF